MASAVVAKRSRRWRVEELARNIHRIRIDLTHKGDEQRVLLMSDVHWDHPRCDRAKLERHLKQAREYDAPILDIGDFFCAMQGRSDRRSSKGDLRREHVATDYFDSLVRTAAAYLEPYKDLVVLRGQGNHETSVLKHHEINLTDRLVFTLRAMGARDVVMGGYSGYVIFDAGIFGRRRSYKMHYHHGHGGGGPVTRGVIATNRHAVYLADADIVWSGHTHDQWALPIARVRLNHDCTRVEHTRQVHLSTPGYKDEYGDGYGGWHIERGGPPKPTGAYWLVFKPTYPNRAAEVDYDIIEAK